MDWDEFYLGLAEYVSRKSKDPSTKVGAVIVRPDRTLVSIGFNGFPRGIADDDRLENRELKYEMVVHAEINALLTARESLHGCTLYTYPIAPCSRCAAQILQTGIKRAVSCVTDYPRWEASIGLATKMFDEAGVFMDVIYRFSEKE